MKKLLFIVAAGLIFQVTPVLADHHMKGEGYDKKKEEMFKKQDTNGDGVISEAEFLTHAKKKFEEKDLNKDGSISKEESEEAHEAMREKRKEMKENWKEKREKNMEKKIDQAE